ncbi:MAG: 3-dehydroquinate dehydratase [Verrucomicrobiales bacterium]|nr:3-dehydroquinate dehydratase [Verrucomicrobiales bacterium]
MHSHTLPEKSSLLRAGQVVGSVVHPSALPLAASAGVASKCDIVEFRVDALTSEIPAVQASMVACPIPSLLTVRDKQEGGMSGLSAGERDSLFTKLLPHAAFIDIEIANFPKFASLIAEARRQNIFVIGSFHDFKSTPEAGKLNQLSSQARDAGADIVKFATTLRHTGDLAILSALQENATLPLATMGMGPLGRVSRLLLASLGSVLNYGFLDQPTVPGQWPAARLRELIRELQSPGPVPPV